MTPRYNVFPNNKAPSPSLCVTIHLFFSPTNPRCPRSSHFIRCVFDWDFNPSPCTNFWWTSQLAFYFGLAPISMAIAAFVVRKGDGGCWMMIPDAAFIQLGQTKKWDGHSMTQWKYVEMFDFDPDWSPNRSQLWPILSDCHEPFFESYPKLVWTLDSQHNAINIIS